MTTIDKRIEAQKQKIAVLDERIGRLMSERVTQEDKLAAMYGEKNGKSPLAKALDTIMNPVFPA